MSNLVVKVTEKSYLGGLLNSFCHCGLIPLLRSGQWEVSIA